MLKGCIFDLDGTLVDSLEDLADAMNRVLLKHGFVIHEINKYNYFVGNGVRKLVERALPDDSLDMLDDCLEDFYIEYENCCLEHTHAYQGIHELLMKLKNNGIKLAVVTNKPHHLANKIINVLFPDIFELVLGNQSIYPVKPDPTSTLKVIEILEIDKDFCVFIGDSNVDIQTGKNAGIKTIGVTWGFRGREELEQEGADYVVSRAFEIGDIVDECWN